MKANMKNLSILFLIGMFCTLGCGSSAGGKESSDPSVKRGRLKFSKSVTALNVGRNPIYRDVKQAVYVKGEEWSPEGDPKFADRLNWCDTSPNPQVEILRCFGNSGENYQTTYILRMKNDQPEMQKIDEGLPVCWLNDDGRWMLFGKSFLNAETGEKIDLKILPLAGQDEGLLLPNYVLGVSPDMKTIVEMPDSSRRIEGTEDFVTLWIISAETGKTEKWKANLTKNPWLKEYKQPVNDIHPPPAPSKHFVWEKDANGKDKLIVPQLLEKITK